MAVGPLRAIARAAGAVRAGRLVGEGGRESHAERRLVTAAEEAAAAVRVGAPGEAERMRLADAVARARDGGKRRAIEAHVGASGAADAPGIAQAQVAALERAAALRAGHGAHVDRAGVAVVDEGECPLDAGRNVQAVRARRGGGE